MRVTGSRWRTMANGWEWEKKGDVWSGLGPGGQRAYVSKSLSGWDAHLTYASGTSYASPKYYTSAASAKAWAERETKGHRWGS